MSPSHDHIQYIEHYFLPNIDVVMDTVITVHSSCYAAININPLPLRTVKSCSVVRVSLARAVHK